MPGRPEIERRARALVSQTFRGKSSDPGRTPTCILTMGVQGAGKSTAIRRRAPASYVRIDPDEVLNNLLRHGALPDGGEVFGLSDEWTERLVRHAIRHRYDFVLDSAMPSMRIARQLKAQGYNVEVLLVTARRPIAREREVQRDMRRGWGRPGVRVEGQIRTRDRIAREGPALASKYADTVTVCDNSGAVMQCSKKCSKSPRQFLRKHKALFSM
ncbi:hypothetical protein WJX74_001921 [Apatococcus lobatus]|uniref:Zeta toxin domain-containing protein n=1 Tax=Apatococcus lobatus TaxID=904363 RepID=A0AAW1QZC7_9CHLO